MMKADRACTDLEVIAAKHHPNDVFANVMHVALDCSHDDHACIVLRGVAAPEFLLFYVGQQVPNSFLHHPCRLDDLAIQENSALLHCMSIARLQ